MRVIVSYLKYVGFAVIGLCFLAIPVSLLLFYLHNGYMPSFGEENAFLLDDGENLGYSKDMAFSSFMCYSILPLSMGLTLLSIILESFVQKKTMWKSFVVWLLFSAFFVLLFTIKIHNMPIAWWLWD